jgi:hypothetical protein
MFTEIRVKSQLKATTDKTFLQQIINFIVMILTTEGLGHPHIWGKVKLK